MLKITSALLASFSLAAAMGTSAPTWRPNANVRKRDGHVYGTGKIGTPKRKRAGRVSARGHHNHGAYLKRARKRQVKRELKRDDRRANRASFVILDEQQSGQL